MCGLLRSKKYDEALPRLKELQRRAISIEGEVGPLGMAVMQNFAQLYSVQKKNNEALKAQLDFFRIAKPVLGETNLHVLNVML